MGTDLLQVKGLQRLLLPTFLGDTPLSTFDGSIGVHVRYTANSRDQVVLISNVIQAVAQPGVD